MAETFGTGTVGSPVLDCPRQQKPKPVHWIEIKLIGEDGNPIPWEEYRIQLPDGQVVRGYLDENGLARVDNIENPGQCTVTFVDLDKEAWEPA